MSFIIDWKQWLYLSAYWRDRNRGVERSFNSNNFSRRFKIRREQDKNNETLSEFVDVVKNAVVVSSSNIDDIDHCGVRSAKDKINR